MCNCNQTTINTTCNTCNPQPCTPTPPCDCPAGYMSSDCINNVTTEFECFDIEPGQTLTETLSQMEQQTCALVEGVTNFISLTNTGNGAEVYKGINGIGQKQIRKVNALGDLVNVTQNTDDISISIDEAELENFVEDLLPNYDANNVGAGAEVFKEETANTFNFRSIKSDTLTITQTTDEILIDQPSTSTIPALYVNSLYEPTEDEFLAGNTSGRGTLNSPFTNTITAYVAGVPTITPNTAIQNALTAYVGNTLIHSRLNPQLQGQKIIVQDNNGTYTFSGDLNYTGLNIELQGNILSTTTGFLLNLDDDTAFNQTDSHVVITIAKNKILQVQGNGFNNSGNTEAVTTYQTGKNVDLLGEGTIYSATDNINKHLINADTANTGNNNDGNLCFKVECKLRADLQGVYLVGGNGKVDFYNEIESGALTNQVDLNLKAFHQTGGQVRLFQGAIQAFTGANENPRKSAITFTPALGFTPTYISQNAKYSGEVVTLFDKLNNSNANLEVTNSISYYGLSLTNVFDSTNLWGVRFTENTLGSGIIDTTKADLTLSNTVSSINTIGNNLVEILRKYPSRTSAESALPTGSKFINTNSDNVDTSTWYVDITML